MKLISCTYACGSLTNFEYAMSGNGNQVNQLKLDLKKSWNHIKLIYCWWILTIWNHCASVWSTFMFNGWEPVWFIGSSDILRRPQKFEKKISHFVLTLLRNFWKMGYFFKFCGLLIVSKRNDVQIRVDMVGTNHDKVLTQWRHMPMGKFRANIFLIRITSTYFWASEVFKIRSSKSWLFWLSGWNIWNNFVN